MPQGLTFNCSMVCQPDGFYEVGVHYSDTDGIDIDILETDDDMEDLAEDLLYDFMEEYLYQRTDQSPQEEEESDEEAVDFSDYYEDYIDQLETIIEDLTYENNSLKTDLKILQRRADDAVNENQKQKESLVKYLNAWLKSLE